jgi:hypothetical protein
MTSLKTDGDTSQTLSDRDLLERITKQQEHADLMLHQIALDLKALRDMAAEMFPHAQKALAARAKAASFLKGARRG